MFLWCAFTAQLLILYLFSSHDLNSVSGFLSSPTDVHSIMESLNSLNNDPNIGHFQIPQDLVSKSLEIKDSISAEAHSLYAAVRQATVTKRVNCALAGILAEVAAGSAGALIAREASIAMIGIDGKKRDSLETKMKFTGAYFGANFLTEDISRVCLGIPKPFALLLAAIVGAAVSTSVKSEGRIADQAARIKACKEAALRRGYYCIGGEFIVNMDVPPLSCQEPKVKRAETVNILNKDMNVNRPIDSVSSNLYSKSLSTRSFFDKEFPVSTIKTDTIQDFCPVFYTTNRHIPKEERAKNGVPFPEVAGDICKWIVFDTLVSNTPWASQTLPFTHAEVTFLHVIYGAIAAVAGKCLQDLTPPKENKPPIPYSQIAAEGGVLFGTYKLMLTYLNSIIPDDWNKQFLFESILEKMEETFF